MDRRDSKRQASLSEEEAGQAAEAPKERGCAHSHGNLPSEPFAYGDHGDHGILPREEGMYLHDEGAVHIRQFHQQQGIMFRIRSRG